MLLALVLFAGTLRAEEPKSEDDEFGIWVQFEDRRGIFLDAKLGLNFASLSTFDGSTNRVTPLVGLSGSYFFTATWGVFADVAATRRALTRGGTAGFATYLDVPIGIAWNTGGGWLGTVAREHYRLAVLFAVPLGDFGGNLAAGTPLATKTALGFQLDNVTLFPLSDSLGVGYTFWIKALLTSTLRDRHEKFAEVGMGFVFSYL